jgi:hypothetical protein
MLTPHKTFEKVLSKLIEDYSWLDIDHYGEEEEDGCAIARRHNRSIKTVAIKAFEAGQTHGEDILDASKLSEEEAKVRFTNPNQAIRCTMKTLAELIRNAEKAKAHFITQSIRHWLKRKEQDDGFIAIDIDDFDYEFKTKDAITKSVEDLAAMRWNVQQSDNKARERLFKSKPKDAKVDKICHAELCPHCNELIALRNPSGFCDHLYYPENCEVCKKHDADAKT